jgi:putative peptidoglycan lipid II flippase
MIVGADIVTLLFRRREFGLESVRLTSSVFFWHMSGLAFIAVNRVIAPAFYARGDTKTPTLAGLVSVGVNIALAFALVGPLRAPGIALALAGASAVNTLVLVAILLRSRVPGASAALARSGRYSLKLVLLSGLAAAPVLAMRPILGARLAGWNVNLAAGVSLAATFLAFGCVGIALLALSRDETALMLVRAFRRRRPR